MYIDNMTSESTNKSIEAHIAQCEECRAVLEQMKQPIPVETAPEVKAFKKYLKKSRMSIFYWIMGVSAFIALLTCFIVNLVIDKQLTWFYIVAGGIATAYIPGYIAINGGRNRILKAMAVLNLCALAFLGVIQVVLYYLMEYGDLWFWKIGLPVAVLWSVILWLSVACYVFLRTNMVLTIGILAALAVPGNYYTNYLSGQYDGLRMYFFSFVSNGLGNTVIAVILLIVGITIQGRKKKNKRSEG